MRVEAALLVWTETGVRERGAVVVGLEPKSVREDEAAVDVEPRVSLPCAA